MNIPVSAHLPQKRLRAFLRDRRGASAVEFALLAPLLITLFLGGVEVSQAVSIDRKVSMTARAVADLTSRTPSVNSTEVTNILDAATAVAAPYPASKLKVKISSLYIDPNGIVKVDWGRARNTTARATGETIAGLPDALKIKDSYLIWAEVEYGYKPTIGYVITGTLNLKEQIYMRPRVSKNVIGPT